MPLSLRPPRLITRPPAGVRRVALLAALAGISAGAQAQAPAANARWVSDDLATWVRSGPGDNYRITGTLRSGEPVALLQTQGDYSQVRAEDGDTVWIRSVDLQEQPSQLARVPELEQQVAQLSNQLAQIDDSWKARVQGMEETLASRKALVDELQAQRQQLAAELNEVQTDLRDARARLDAGNQELLMRYLVYGGSIAGAGLLAGLILPLLFRRRKRNDRWF